MVPQEVNHWLQAHYSRPLVDQQWLDDCYDWITGPDGKNLSPDTSMPEILAEIEVQLLSSDLSASTQLGTGLPVDAPTMGQTRLTGPPVLVSIASITEIGYSALSLQRTKEAREERIAAGEIEVETEDGEEEGEGVRAVGGRIPRYQRGMLQFEITDGNVTIKAIEYKRIAALELGVTPLGYKILLKNTRIVSGTAFLEPETIEIKGYCDADLDAFRDQIFSRNLRSRLGQPEPIEEEGQENANPPQPPAQVHANPIQPVPNPPPPAPQPARAALREVLVPSSSNAGHHVDEHRHDDDELQPHRRKVPHRSPEPDAPPRPQDDPSRSVYFSGPSTSAPHNRELQNALHLSPSRVTTTFIKPERGFIGDLDLLGLVGGRTIGTGVDKGKAKANPAPAAKRIELEWGAAGTLGFAATGKDIPEPARQAGGNSKPDGRTIGDDPGSDFDYFGVDPFDDATLAGLDLDKVENEAKRAIASAQSESSSSKASSQRNQPSMITSSSDIIEIDDDDDMHGFASGSGSADHIIEVDVEDDDKENVPVPTRHVRQRVAAFPTVDEEDAVASRSAARGSQGVRSGSQRTRSQRPVSQDLGVIEISDSD
ncbi:hypothetical protein HGRIS_003911 [Hohenbuehelia grisea]|uniref:RecQ-mediated genome instability protein 1 n=1 Tax=Hohenbuehelia grisea TaxID=104357 RepID=A0ABR3JHD0_9AGAR